MEDVFDRCRRGCRNQIFRSLSAEADAVGNSDAVVGIAGEAKAGKRCRAGDDAGDALLMAYCVLGHGAAPARDLSMFRLYGKADRFFS